jgi:excisionase family DNA binding protein
MSEKTMFSTVLTIEGAARVYRNRGGDGLTATGLRRLVRAGEIPSRKVGAKYLIRGEDIERWLAGEDFTDSATPAPQGKIRRVEA